MGSHVIYPELAHNLIRLPPELLLISHMISRSVQKNIELSDSRRASTAAEPRASDAAPSPVASNRVNFGVTAEKAELIAALIAALTACRLPCNGR